MFLIRKSGTGKAHHWTGTDTACRMASTGGLLTSKYVVSDHTNGRLICHMCQAVLNREQQQPNVTNLQDWQQTRENDQLDAEYARIARSQGKTVQQLEDEYLEHIDQEAEKDPEFQLWRLANQSRGFRHE